MSKIDDCIILPPDIRFDERLTSGAVTLYGEIVWLCDENNRCFVPNHKFAEAFSVSETAIKHRLSELEKCGYIKRFRKLEGDDKTRPKGRYIVPRDNFEELKKAYMTQEIGDDYDDYE